MHKWEYLVVDERFEALGKSFDNFADLASELGLAGWELVSVTTITDHQGTDLNGGKMDKTREMFYFKRPITE